MIDYHERSTQTPDTCCPRNFIGLDRGFVGCGPVSDCRRIRVAEFKRSALSDNNESAVAGI